MARNDLAIVFLGDAVEKAKMQHPLDLHLRNHLDSPVDDSNPLTFNDESGPRALVKSSRGMQHHAHENEALA